MYRRERGPSGSKRRRTWRARSVARGSSSIAPTSSGAPRSDASFVSAAERLASDEFMYPSGKSTKSTVSPANDVAVGTTGCCAPGPLGGTPFEALRVNRGKTIAARTVGAGSNIRNADSRLCAAGGRTPLRQQGREPLAVVAVVGVERAPLQVAGIQSHCRLQFLVWRNQVAQRVVPGALFVTVRGMVCPWRRGVRTGRSSAPRRTPSVARAGTRRG